MYILNVTAYYIHHPNMDKTLFIEWRAIMEGMTILCEAFVPLYCLYYGYRLKKNPPKMGERGLGTKLAMQSQAAWDMANSYGAKLCLIYGAITALMFIVRIALFGFSINIPFSLSLITVELVCVISILPLINNKIKKTFGNGKKK